MKKAFVMLSGGVDSSVAAARLVDAGYDVTGIFMKNWSYDRVSGSLADLLAQTCPTKEDAQMAQQVAKHLNIPFRVINFEQEYWDKVIEPFFDQYAKGLTPNPDVWCNQYIKFGVFLDWALEHGANLVATGHYARLRKVACSRYQVARAEYSKNSHASCYISHATIQLFRATDPSKDQSYFLAHVSPEKLKYALFPIGHLYKSQVRAEAATRGLPTATRKDSQGICFIGKIPIKEFLKERLPEKKGDIILPSGQVIGQHQGAWFYTIGQRHINVQNLKPINQGTDPKPLYIVDKDIKKNQIIVDFDRGQPPLWKDKIEVNSIHWYHQPSPKSFRSNIEIRYHQNPLPNGKITYTGKQGVVQFDQMVRAIAPGQTVVFSKGSEILGAGIITS